MVAMESAGLKHATLLEPTVNVDGVRVVDHELEDQRVLEELRRKEQEERKKKRKRRIPVEGEDENCNAAALDYGDGNGEEEEEDEEELNDFNEIDDDKSEEDFVKKSVERESNTKISESKNDGSRDHHTGNAEVAETETEQMIRRGLLTPFSLLPPNSTDATENGIDTDCPQGESSNGLRKSILKCSAAIRSMVDNRRETQLLDVDPASSGANIRYGTEPHVMKARNNRSMRERDVKSIATQVMQRKRMRNGVKNRSGQTAGSNSRRKIREQHADDTSFSGVDLDEKDEDVGIVDDDFGTHVTFEGGLCVPTSIWQNLFDYQRTAVQWLWELHCQRAGGIVGDEMGLGKTVQVAAFLAAMQYSRKYEKTLIVCPATVMSHWKTVLKTWWPSFLVRILHSSVLSKSSKQQVNNLDKYDHLYETSQHDMRGKIIGQVCSSDSGILITTYETLKTERERLLPIYWGYVILDEGHRIRNPNAETTIVCKQLRTIHRLLLTGAPIQNKLTELWSLFDFIYPGKLGTLPVFESEFAVPIQLGSYANAGKLQVQTSYRCSLMLRTIISPYILRRVKADVRCNLPEKTEQILFVSLTPKQLDLYRGYIHSKEVQDILSNDRNALGGIDTLRKLCNHPDLLERSETVDLPDYGNPVRSGKLKVLLEVLKAWHSGGHRCLIFAQTQQMLDIIETTILKCEGQYTYRRMDGSTSISQRSNLIDEFNGNDDVFIFLLTTRVGGIGVNLIGADRVLLYDPDWNPSTDAQARERAWRVGQSKPVTVYRLITSGTVEEKIYHRQVFKQSITNNVLNAGRHKGARYFNARDLADLFSLGQEYAQGKGTETADIFDDIYAHIDIGAEETHVHGEDQPTVQRDREEGDDVSQFKSRTANTKFVEVLPSNGDGNTGSESNMKSETSILQKLFNSGTEFHAAMDHDTIMGASEPNRSSHDAEASLVAKAAVAALKKSREALRGRHVFTPTWTGQVGLAGAPPFAARFGRHMNASSVGSFNDSNVASNAATHSSNLLQRIRERKMLQDAAHGHSQSGAHDLQAKEGENRKSDSLSLGGLVNDHDSKLLNEIHQYLLSQPRRRSTSQALIKNFETKIDSSKSSLFRQFLKNIAKLESDSSDGPKMWTLREEFI